jgi:putative flavoprotein involved in K+ transport
VDVKEIRALHVLSDGSELPADLIVYATGYGSMNGWAADLISHEVADKVGKCWGLGSATTKDPGPWEGEQRNMWKPTQQQRCGSMAATCTSRATIRSIWRCS